MTANIGDQSCRNEMGHRAGNSIAIVLLGLQVALCLIAMQFNSPTMDEPAHIARGYHYVTTGKLSLDVSPPLMNALSALPVLFQKGVIIPPPDPMYGFSVTDFADKFVWVYNDAETIVNSARLATILLSVVLGYFVFCWARHLWGMSAGLLALVLYVFDPNILAHSQLATTDLGVTCFIFIATFFLWRFLRSRQNADLVLAGVLLGLAQAAKFSALILVPVFVITVLCEAFLIRDWTLHGHWPWHGHFAQGRGVKATYFCCAILVVVLGLSLMSLWASYRFEMSPLLSKPVQAIVDRLVSHSLLRDALERHVVPLSSYVRGLRWMQRWSERTVPVFLMGEYSGKGWWYYVLAAVAFKTPIPTLALLAITALLTLRSLGSGEELGERRGMRQREYILVLPILGFLLAAMIFHSLQLSYRHVLPMLPFAFVLSGRMIHWQRSRVGRLALAALALWYVTGTMRVYPHWLAYFNELVGGPDNGYEYLVGSNLDWGQDLKNLKVYMDQQGLDRVYLAYYGSAHPDYYGIQALPLPADGPPAEAEAGALYAISATYLQGSYLDNPDAFSWLRKYAPVGKIGYSIFVYRPE